MNKEAKDETSFGETVKGPAKSTNQDKYSSSVFENVTVLNVCDGHGTYGELASETVNTFIGNWAKEKYKEFDTWTNTKWRKEMKRLFSLCHDEIRTEMLDRIVDSWPDVEVIRDAKDRPIHAGTTCTICVIVINKKTGQRTLITANVGDSHAMLCNGEEFTLLTEDHSPASAEEYARIAALSPILFPLKFVFVYSQRNEPLSEVNSPSVFNPDGTKNQKPLEDPNNSKLIRSNVRGGYAKYAITPLQVGYDATFLAMTRALGDFQAQQFGCTDEPDVSFRQLDQHVEYTLWLASDGIWDCWKYEDFFKFNNELLEKTRESKGKLNVEEVIQEVGMKSFEVGSTTKTRGDSSASEEIEGKTNRPTTQLPAPVGIEVTRRKVISQS